MYSSHEETKKDDLQYEHKIRGINSNDFLFNPLVILIGEPFVGKTSLLSKFTKDVFPKAPNSTIAVEFCTKIITLKDSSRISVQFWDTAGQEKYKAVVSKKALGAFLVYDITKRDTFSKLKETIEDLREKAEPDCAMFLVGNKYDLVIDNPNLRQVSLEEAKQWASKEKMHFMETSALLGYKVTEAFELLAECKFILTIRIVACKQKLKSVNYNENKVEAVDISKRKNSNKEDRGCCNL